MREKKYLFGFRGSSFDSIQAFFEKTLWWTNCEARDFWSMRFICIFLNEQDEDRENDSVLIFLSFKQLGSVAAREELRNDGAVVTYKSPFAQRRS